MGEKLDPEAKRLRNVSPGELADAEGDEERVEPEIICCQNVPDKGKRPF
jgi:hypothetical protein